MTQSRAAALAEWLNFYLTECPSVRLYPPERERLTEISALLIELERERDEARALHHELLYQVAEKYPGETRHETAKRYLAGHAIRCASGVASAAHIEDQPDTFVQTEHVPELPDEPAEGR